MNKLCDLCTVPVGTTTVAYHLSDGETFQVCPDCFKETEDRLEEAYEKTLRKILKLSRKGH